jgi:hypothetical protein
MNVEQVLTLSKPIEGKYPSGPHAGKISLTGPFHFKKEIPTRTGKKMCTFLIGSQKCLCFDTLADKMIQKHDASEGQDVIVVGRHRDGEFVADWAYSTELRVSPSTVDSRRHESNREHR